MDFIDYLIMWGAALVVFVIVDLTWLGLVANNLYRDEMGDLLRDKPNVPVAVAFYLLFLIGLVYFAIGPAASSGEYTDALVKGALFGFFTYATYDLTNLAVLNGYPAKIAVIDIVWGTVLSAIVASGSWYVHDLIRN